MRLVIVDQSYMDEVGHHHTYNLNLLSAARAQGLETILLANKRLSKTLAVQTGAQRFLTRTWRTDDRHALIAMGSVAASYLPEPWRDTLAQGTRRLVQKHKPTKNTNQQNHLQRERTPPFYPLLQNLKAWGKQHGWQSNDIVFVHTLKTNVATSLIRHADRVFDNQDVTLVVMLRTECPSDAKAQHLQQAWSHQKTTRVQVVTDTKMLADSLSSQLKQSVVPLPIPAQGTLYPLPQKRTPTPPYKVGYAGEARLDKGLKRLANTLQQRPPQTIFFIHAPSQRREPSPQVSHWLKQIQEQLGPQDRFSRAPLTTEDFTKFLDDCDVLLLPYEAERYAQASSGMLIEALQRGLSCLVPANTWMATMVHPHHGMTYSDETQIPQRLHELCEQLKKQGRAPSIAVEHTPHNLLKSIVTLATSQN